LGHGCGGERPIGVFPRVGFTPKMEAVAGGEDVQKQSRARQVAARSAGQRPQAWRKKSATQRGRLSVGRWRGGYMNRFRSWRDGTERPKQKRDGAPAVERLEVEEEQEAGGCGLAIGKAQQAGWLGWRLGGLLALEKAGPAGCGSWTFLHKKTFKKTIIIKIHI
jgi:hypothetical protein